MLRKTNVILDRGTWEVCPQGLDMQGAMSPLSGLEVEASQAAGSGQVRMGVECQGQGGRGRAPRLAMLV